MKEMMAGLLLVALAGQALAEEPAPAPQKAELKSTNDKASYIIGLTIGRDLKRQGLDGLDLKKLILGISDSLTGAEKQVSDEEMQEVMKEFEKEHTANQVAKIKEASDKNKKEGDAFLAANKKKADVITTKSGLQYQVLKAGKGKKPLKGDTVTTHYKGALLNGTEFDSSFKRGEPATFPVGGVIAGWTEALQLMPVGSKWRLYVPAELAYGAQGAGPDIGPNATLVFDVELLDIGEGKEDPQVEEIPEQ